MPPSCFHEGFAPLQTHVSLHGCVHSRQRGLPSPSSPPRLNRPHTKAQRFLCCHLAVRSPPAISEFIFRSFFSVPHTRINHTKCLFLRNQTFEPCFGFQHPPAATFSKRTESYVVQCTIKHVPTSGTLSVPERTFACIVRRGSTRHRHGAAYTAAGLHKGT